MRFPNHPFAENSLITQKHHYEKDELLDCGHGRLFGPGNAQLPLPDMLMFDRIVRIDDDGGEYGRASSSPNSTSPRTCGFSSVISRATR